MTTNNSLNSCYIDKFREAYSTCLHCGDGVYRFSQIDFEGDFGSAKIDTESLRGRISFFNKLSYFCITAVFIDILVMNLFSNLVRECAVVLVFLAFCCAYMNLESKSINKIFLIQEEIYSGSIQNAANALILAGPDTLLRSWKLGLFDEEILSFALTSINKLGQSFGENERDFFDNKAVILETAEVKIQALRVAEV